VRTDYQDFETTSQYEIELPKVKKRTKTR